MSDLANKTLLLLILISIVISLAGILTAPRGIVYMTGLAGSGSSSASINITEEVSVKITGTIDFYSGRVYQNATYAILDSNLGKYNTQYTPFPNAINISQKGRVQVVYDIKRDKIVLFGGFGGPNGTDYYNETWEYNGSEWTNVTVSGPSARHTYGMAYDSRRNVTVLFGGIQSSWYNDTWEYNGTAWTQINTQSAPQARTALGGMAFDNKRNVTVLYGGWGMFGTYLNDTWEYNGTNWNQIQTATNPGRLEAQVMDYDSYRGVAVMFGGSREMSSFTNETWEYDGSDWTNRTGTFSGDYPVQRIFASLVFDSSRNISVLAGGSNFASYLSDTWEYDGNKWYRNFEADDYLAGSSGFEGSGAFDTNRNKVVIFAGVIDMAPTAFLNTTIEYNASEANGIINGTWFFYKQYFHVDNDGTVNISVNFTADKNASAFLGGTSPSFQVKGVITESGACPDLITSYTEVQNTSQNLCPLLKFGQTADQFRIPIRLQIPNDAAAGLKNATVTISAAKA